MASSPDKSCWALNVLILGFVDVVGASSVTGLSFSNPLAIFSFRLASRFLAFLLSADVESGSVERKSKVCTSFPV